jgi:hypothetical protein
MTWPGKAGYAVGWTMLDTAAMMRQPKPESSRESLSPFLRAGASRLIPGDGATGDQARRIITTPGQRSRGTAKLPAWTAPPSAVQELRSAMARLEKPRLLAHIAE